MPADQIQPNQKVTICLLDKEQPSVSGSFYVKSSMDNKDVQFLWGRSSGLDPRNVLSQEIEIELLVDRASYQNEL